MPRASATPATRLFSTEDTPKPQFSGENAKWYKLISENHRHPNGPWVTMVDKVHIYANEHGSKLNILDLATGPGEPAETIARQLPECTIVATDLSPDQVALANEQTATLAHMTAVVADMQDLSDFDTNSFDLVTCCYGFMFPEDISRAIAESYRVLKPGGQLIATTWNKLSIMMKIRAIVTEIIGKEPPPPPINPLSLAEPGLFENLLKDAGYDNIQCKNYEYPFDLTSDPEAQFQSTIIPIREKLDEWDAWEQVEKHSRTSNMTMEATTTMATGLYPEMNTN